MMVSGPTSRSFCGCCYLPVQVPEEIAPRTWCLELPAIVQIDFMYVSTPLICRLRSDRLQSLSTRI